MDVSISFKPYRHGPRRPDYHRGNIGPSLDGGARQDMPDPLLQVRDLTIQFRSSPEATVDRVSFDLLAGETAGLLGESGCGKTTLGRALLGLFSTHCRLRAGSVRLRGQDLPFMNPRQMRRIRGSQISLIPQEPELALNPVIRIGKQIEEVLLAHSHDNRSSRKRDVESILAAVGLSGPDFYSAFPHQLSGGQRQRAVIAQALVSKPAVLIADEPTSAIDTITQAAILDLLRTLQQRFQLAIFYITHDPDLLRGFANRLLIMHAGQIVEEGLFSEVYSRPRHPYTKDLFQSVPPWPGPPVPVQ